MEPRAIANLNGMLVPTPVRNSNGGASRSSQTAPSTPANRRASALWIRTPDENSENHENEDGGDDNDDTEWNTVLTPVPKTPAPEAIARFAVNLSPGSSSESSIDDQGADDDDENRAALMTRTCPPKPAGPNFFTLGAGVLAQEKDERVLMRLMAARRKSLQFAPKVGSPLAKQWTSTY